MPTLGNIKPEVVKGGKLNPLVQFVCFVNNLCFPPGHPYGTPLQHIQFEVTAEEIVGIAGVAGNRPDFSRHLTRIIINLKEAGSNRL